MTATASGDHGTVRGYRRHERDRTPPCDPCKAARAEYQRNYRALNHRAQLQEQRQQMLRRRALSRLADLYPDEYRRIYADVAIEAGR